MTVEVDDSVGDTASSFIESGRDGAGAVVDVE